MWQHFKGEVILFYTHCKNKTSWKEGKTRNKVLTSNINQTEWSKHSWMYKVVSIYQKLSKEGEEEGHRSPRLNDVHRDIAYKRATVEAVDDCTEKFAAEEPSLCLQSRWQNSPKNSKSQSVLVQQIGMVDTCPENLQALPVVTHGNSGNIWRMWQDNQAVTSYRTTTPAY